MRRKRLWGRWCLWAAALGAGGVISAQFAVVQEMIVQADNEEPIEVEEEEGEAVFVPSEIPSPVFSAESGFYSESFELTISLPEGYEDGKIVYTLNGSLPNAARISYMGSQASESAVGTLQYDGAITIKKRTESTWDCLIPTIIRAMVVSADGECSDVVTQTYFCSSQDGDGLGIGVVSLTTDRENLYDSKTGLFQHTGESGREWERPANFTYFSEDGAEQLNMDIGIRLHGGASRDFSMKSFRLYARDDYDTENWFEYDFFSESPVNAVQANGQKEVVDRFKRIILRNGGNEGQSWDSTLLRDAFIQSLMTDTSLDLQAYRPVVVYLNGRYYGLMNMRERQDKYYISEHYNCSREDVVVYSFWYEGQEQRYYVSDGDGAELEFYETFYTYVKENDLSVPENYAQVEEWLDIDNYIDYICLEVFCGNTDWPGNNCRAWRYTGEPKAAYGLDGRIRYLVYDTEFGMGLYNRQPSEDFLGEAMQAGGWDWPNQDGSTLLLRKLMENDTFRQKFATRYMDLLNTNFSKDVCYEQLEEMAAVIEPYFDDFRQKYNYTDKLDNNINSMKSFIQLRAGYAFREIQNHCDSGDKYKVSIQVSDVEGLDYLVVNTIDGINAEHTNVINNKGCFVGSYASEIDVNITAVAKEGYVFAGWAEADTMSEAHLVLNGIEKNKTISLIPVFAAEDSEPESDAAGEEGEADGDATGLSPDWLLYGGIGAVAVLLAGGGATAWVADRRRRR